MANPPAAVKLALESICLLLGESTTDWKQIRSIIMRENFIPTIVNFSAEEIRWAGGRGPGLLLPTRAWASRTRPPQKAVSAHRSHRRLSRPFPPQTARFPLPAPNGSSLIP